MSDVDDAIERAERDYADDEATMWEDRRILAAEVKRLREKLADCRKGIVRWREPDRMVE